MANVPREISPAMENSPLARLPREIRDEIYTYALHFKNGITVNVGGQSPKLKSPTPSQYPLGLTHVCAQVRRECISMFYLANSFQLTTSLDGHRNTEMIEDWLTQIGTVNKSALQKVEVDLGPWTPGYTTPSSAYRHTIPLPLKAVSYITCFRAMEVPVTFRIDVRYSDIPGLGQFELRDLDLVAEEKVFGTGDSKFEKACLQQARKIEDFSAESRIESYAVIRLLMGLDRCRNSYAEFLYSIARELAVQRAIRDARKVR